MEFLKLCDKDSVIKYLEMANELEKNKIMTGVEGFDMVFNGLRAGSIYLIAAPTGSGKTSFLISMAKQLSKIGKRVLFITVEQNMTQIIRYFKDWMFDSIDLMVMNELKEWNEVDNIYGDYDVVLYDYIGALSEGGDMEWKSLRIDTNDLAQRAKKYNVPFICACQAKDDVKMVKKEDPSLRTNMYLCFSKGIAVALAGGVYLKPDMVDKRVVYLVNFKNRYERICDKIVSVMIDFGNKEFY